MAQYVQKIGGEAVDLSTLAGQGISNLQQASDSGYNPVSAPKINNTVTNTTTPVNTPVQPVSGEIKPVEAPQVFNKEQIKTDITKTLATEGIGTKKANQAFIDAAFRYAYGRNPNENDNKNVAGKTVSQVTEMLKIGNLAPAMGQTLNEVPKGETTQTNNVNEPVSPISSAIDNLIAQKTSGMGKALDLNTYSQAKNDANVAVETARQAIADKQLLDAVKIDEISKGQPIPMVEIQKQQNKFSADEYIDNLKMAQDYNNKLILSKMAEGNFLEAQNINKSIAADIYEIEKLKIDKAVEEQRITENQATLLRQDEETEFARRDAGYIKIDEATFNNLPEEQRVAIGGKFYKTPVASTELDSLNILAKKLDIEAKMLQNELIGDDKFQSTVTTGDGMYRITYDSYGNEINRNRIGDAPEGANKITATQYEAAGYANRIEQAESMLNELAGVGTGLGEAFGARALPNLFKGEDRKRFEQAERNFINAQLRRESGAAIADSEFESARLQYIPQPGDGDKTLKQKAQNRATVLKSLKLEAGSAITGNNTSSSGITNTEDLFN